MRGGTAVGICQCHLATFRIILASIQVPWWQISKVRAAVTSSAEWELDTAPPGVMWLSEKMHMNMLPELALVMKPIFSSHDIKNRTLPVCSYPSMSSRTWVGHITYSIGKDKPYSVDLELVLNTRET